MVLTLQLHFTFLLSSSHPCLPQESAALLHFKTLFSIHRLEIHYYYDYLCANNSYPQTESWEQGSDCCSSWDGVTCDGADGHVTGLDLTCNRLRPKADHFTNTSSMLGLHLLPRLRSLNLAFNDFYGSQMPSEIARLSGLEYLNLSHSYFSGEVTYDLSSLSNLVVLDLSWNWFGLNFDVTSFKTLVTNLTKLEVLDLSESDLSSVSFASPINFTHSLRSLRIDVCGLHGHLHEESFKNLPNLESLSLVDNFGLEGMFPQLNWSSPIKLLDLSGTNLSGPLPKSIRKLNKLKSLVLSECHLSGSLSPLENLTELNRLGLGGNLFSGSIPDSFSDFTQLTYLALSYNELTGPIPAGIFSLPQLQEVHLSDNSLTGHLHEFHSKALTTLYLDNNKLQCSIPGSLLQLVNLTRLILGSNKLNGTVDLSKFLNLQNLQVLDFSGNNLTVSVKQVTGNAPELSDLNLRSCNLSEFPEFISNNSQLQYLDLSDNKLNGEVPAWMFEVGKSTLQSLNMSHNFLTSFQQISWEELYILDLRSNSITGNISILPPQLRVMLFANNKLTGGLPHSICNSSDLLILDLGSCNLTEFPEFIRNNSQLQYLDLSDNKLKGEVPAWMFEVGKSTLLSLNMSHNSLTSFQQISWERLGTLDLRSNSITGNISILAPQLAFLLLANNKLTGGLPDSICSSPYLQILDLSNNSLSGTIPQCLPKSNSLLVLDLRINKFHGTIPDTFPQGCGLQTLNLRDNELEGRVPQSLASCTELGVLDLGNNKLKDTFPSWLAPLPELEVLVLHYNQLYGNLLSSTSKIQFPKLRILDVSNNKFNGVISENFLKHFKAMTKYIRNTSSRNLKRYYQDSVVLTLKGFQYEMERILILFTALDLSNNDFQGQIPRLIGDFQALKVLNLSHNNLTGQIPESLGNLIEMETLDLSWNQLVGKIPQQLASLTFLAVFNLSQNRLVGSIPQSTQFSTFGNNSYIGNLGLCGFPLSKECNISKVPIAPHEEDYSFADEFTWQPVLIGYVGGFIIAVVASYFMFLTGKPQWIIEIIEKESNRILRRRSRRHGGRRN